MKATKKELYKTLDQYFLKQEFDFCWNSTLEVFGCIPKTKVNLHWYIYLINVFIFIVCQINHLNQRVVILN